MGFQMIDVGAKPATLRRATAQGRIHLQPDAYRAMVERTNPKGDVLAVADVAGIQAAKKTSDLLPLCHPLPLDSVRLAFECEPQTHSVLVTCTATTTARTGVEMEALSGVSGALLCIYDLSKAVNPVIELGAIRLNTKEGGKSGLWTHPGFKDGKLQSSKAVPAGPSLSGVPAAVITVSDRCSRGEAEDLSGPALLASLRDAGAGVAYPQPICVPDEVDLIRRAIQGVIREQGVKLLVLTGGTGLSPRDVTPEALEPLWTRRIPGIGELLRKRGEHQTAMSWISRSEAGLVGSTLVVCLPGSLRAVRDGWHALAPVLPHALEIIGGAKHGGVINGASK